MFPVKIENDIVVIISDSDQVRHEDVIETLSFLADNSTSYQNKKLIIIDPISNYNPSNEELKQFIELVISLLQNIFPQIALVVSKDFHYGLGRMTEVLTETERGQFRVFHDEQEARDWLST